MINTVTCLSAAYLLNESIIIQGSTATATAGSTVCLYWNMVGGVLDAWMESLHSAITNSTSPHFH